jgi:hypothetical protein
VRKRVLTKEQEDRIVQRIQSEFINQKSFCPPQMIQRIAIEIHREQPDKEEGGEAFNNEDPFIPRDDEEFLPVMKEKMKPSAASRALAEEIHEPARIVSEKTSREASTHDDLVDVELHQIRME